MDNLNEFKELIADKLKTKEYKKSSLPAWRKSLELMWNQTFFLWHFILILCEYWADIFILQTYIRDAYVGNYLII